MTRPGNYRRINLDSIDEPTESITSGVENLFDKQYATYADWNHIPQKGRNIYMNLTFEL